jgi:hypothetical protein
MGGNKSLLTIFAGKIFPPHVRWKESINHCDLALARQALEHWRHLYCVVSLLGSIEFTINIGRAGDGRQ